MTKALSKQTSHDGSLTVGQVVPSDYSPHTNWKTSDGSKSMHSSMLQKEQQMETKLNSLVKKEKKRRSLRIAKDKEIIRSRLKEYRERGRPGAKLKMTDEQALYCRRECKTRSLKSIGEELGFSRDVVERCIKGFTFKHLWDKEKPQW